MSLLLSPMRLGELELPNRVLFMDRMEIRKDGTLVVHGPTTTPQPVPSSGKVRKS